MLLWKLILACFLVVAVSNRPLTWESGPATDKHKLRGASGMASTSLMQDEAANETEGCPREILEASCAVFSCDRGPHVECDHGRCVCEEGYCAKAGECVNETGDHGHVFADRECVDNAMKWQQGLSREKRMMDANDVPILADKVWHSFLVLKVGANTVTEEDGDGFPKEQFIGLELQPNAWTHELSASEVDGFVSGCGYHQMLQLRKGKAARVVHLGGKSKVDKRWKLKPGVTVKTFFEHLDQREFWDPDRYNCQNFTRDMLRDTDVLDAELCSPEGDCQTDYSNYLTHAVMHGQDLVTGAWRNKGVAALIGKMGLHPPCGSVTRAEPRGKFLWDGICGGNPMMRPIWRLHEAKAICPTSSEILEITLYWRDSTLFARTVTNQKSRKTDWCLRHAALDEYEQRKGEGASGDDTREASETSEDREEGGKEAPERLQESHRNSRPRSGGGNSVIKATWKVPELQRKLSETKAELAKLKSNYSKLKASQAEH